MTIEDSGTFSIGGYPGTTFRNIYVFPPGWAPPTVTENVTLSHAVTVGAAGLLVAGHVESGGEKWRNHASIPNSRRVGYIPGSASGSYSAGATVPIYRMPRLPVAHRKTRGSAPTGLPVTPATVWRSVVAKSTQRSRSTTHATIAFNATHGFVVGQRVTVTGISVNGYDVKDIAISSVTSSSITYPLAGLSEGLTTELNGYAEISREDTINRSFQFSAVKPSIRCTGCDLSTNSGGTILNMNSGLRGAKIALIMQLMLPYDPNVTGGGGFAAKLTNIWAPFAAEETPDFSVDVDIPDYESMRIIWHKGIPQAASISTDEAPYPSCTRTGRQWDHSDTMAYYLSQAVIAVRMREDGGLVRSIASLATPSISETGGYALRASLIGVQKVGLTATIYTLGFPGIVHSCLGQWMRKKANGSFVYSGASFALAYSVWPDPAPPFNQMYWIDDNACPAPVDATDNPTEWFLETRFDYENASGGRSTIVNRCQGNGQDVTAYYWWQNRNYGEWPALHPWPFDVPLLRFATDETDVRYVGNPGWLFPIPTVGAVTVVPPTISRTNPTTIAETIGSATATDATENVVPVSRAILLRGNAPSVVTKDGGSSSTSSSPISVTEPLFAGQSVRAEAWEIWSSRSSQQGQYCTIRDLYESSTLSTV